MLYLFYNLVEMIKSSMEEKKDTIKLYIENLAQQINQQYPGLMSEKLVLKAVEMFQNSEEDLETQIIPKIQELAKKRINDFQALQPIFYEMEQRGKKSELENLALLNLNTDLAGIYLSQQEIDLLMITNLQSKEEIANFIEKGCFQFSTKKPEDIIKNFGAISDFNQLEEAKKELYEEYQKNLVNYLKYAQMSDENKARKKLERIGIKEEDIQKCLPEIKAGKIKETFASLAQKYGEDFVTKFNRSMNDDFENVQGVSYEEMKSLAEFIKKDSSLDTIIIATGKYDNTIYQGLNGKIFDPYFTKKALEFCQANGKHMRYHALFDQMHVENLLKQGKGKQDHDQILAEMQAYVKMSMNFIAENNCKMADGTMLINEVEIFNELIERNKKDKNAPYEMVWEKYFGISMEEIMNCFQDIPKLDGVKFMYNETTLTESPNKRKDVEQLLFKINQINPNLVTLFGDQMHLSNEDIVTLDGKVNLQNLQETAQMLKRIQDGKIIVDGKVEQITPKQIECTEHDFHFTKDFIENMNIGANSKRDTWAIKKGMQDIVSKTYLASDIKFTRCTYWSLFGKNDHNLCRENLKQQRENSNWEPKDEISTLQAGILKDGTTFDNAKTLISPKKVPFDYRSETEKQVAQQIRAKNDLVATQKHKEKNDAKVLVKTKNDGNANKGSMNKLILLIVTLVLDFLIVMVFIR